MTLALKPPKNSLLSQRNLENTITIIRKIVICTVVVLLTVLIFGSSFTQSEALVEKRTDTNGDVYYVATGYEPMYVKNLHSKTFGGVVLDLACSVYGGGFGFLAKGALKINIDAPFFVTAIGVYDSIAAIGAGLALFWCILALIDKASTGHVTGEFLLELGIKFTIAALIISEGKEIAKGLIGFANGLATTIYGNPEASEAGTASSTDALFYGVYTQIEKAGIFDCIGTIIPLLLSSLMMKLCTIIMCALLVGRLIDVSIRFMFFPIGASDVFSQGLSSPGFRYMRRLLASALQGVVMYSAVIIGASLMSQNVSELFGSAGTHTVGGVLLSGIWPLITGISTVGAMLKVSSIANDIVG